VEEALAGKARVSFLDNLENNLKALEGREERDPEALRAEAENRAAERAAALGRAPFEQALKSSPFGGALIASARRTGHERRIPVRPSWIDAVLRLEATVNGASRKLELQARAGGVDAVCFDAAGAEERREVVELDSGAACADALAVRWLDALAAERSSIAPVLDSPDDL